MNITTPSKQPQQKIANDSHSKSGRFSPSKQFSDLFSNTGGSNNNNNNNNSTGNLNNNLTINTNTTGGNGNGIADTDDASTHSHGSEKQGVGLVDMVRPNTGLALPSTGNHTIKHSDTAVQPTFNIVDSTMTIKMFVFVLLQCPELVNIFDRQLEDRLIHCYGRDVRHTHESLDLGIDDENKDYSWIIALKKKTPKKKIHKASIYDKEITPCTIESIFPSHYD